jgi:hypothetical protein
MRARTRSCSLPLLKFLCTSLLSSRGSCLSLRYSSVHAFFVAVSFLFVNAFWEIILSVLTLKDFQLLIIRDFGALENRVVRALGQNFSYLGKYRSLNISVAASCEFV